MRTRLSIAFLRCLLGCDTSIVPILCDWELLWSLLGLCPPVSKGACRTIAATDAWSDRSTNAQGKPRKTAIGDEELSSPFWHPHRPTYGLYRAFDKDMMPSPKMDSVLKFLSNKLRKWYTGNEVIINFRLKYFKFVTNTRICLFYEIVLMIKLEGNIWWVVLRASLDGLPELHLLLTEIRWGEGGGGVLGAP